jgi:hypothetical protein
MGEITCTSLPVMSLRRERRSAGPHLAKWTTFTTRI